MYKHLFIPIVVLFLLMGKMVKAEERNALVVHFKDGTATTFLLENKPHISFYEGFLKIESTSISTEYDRKDILRFVYTHANPEGIILNPRKAFVCYNNSGAMNLSGLRPKTTVRLISIDGRLLAEDVVSTNGKVCILLDSFPSGIYIVQSEGFIHKFTKP